MVADNESGKSIESEVRTSSGTFLRKAQVCETRFIYILQIIGRSFLWLFAQMPTTHMCCLWSIVLLVRVLDCILRFLPLTICFKC